MTESPPAIDERHAAQARFFYEAQRDGADIQRRLARARILILGAGALGSHLVEGLAHAGVGEMRIHDPAGAPRAHALCAEAAARYPHLGFRAGPDDPEDFAGAIGEVDCAVVCADSPIPLLAEAVNEAALRAEKRWLLGRVDRGIGLIGPTVIPRESACYECFLLRRAVNLADADERQPHPGAPPGRGEGLAAPRALAAAIGSLLALEVLRLLSGAAPPQTVNRVLRLSFFAAQATYHRILRFPGCPACGFGARRPPWEAQGACG
jgi:bacteriocin biosynthesis cyclodehydratase domain-containing protein